jgi:hypothetical protein
MTLDLPSARLLCEALERSDRMAGHPDYEYVVGFRRADARKAADQLRAMVVEIERLRAQVASLEANAVLMSEYRFALENIPTDGKGNPLPGDTRKR